MVSGLVACGSPAPTTQDASTSESSTETTTETDSADSGEITNVEADGTVYTVGICQLVQHEALDAATQGFMDALSEELGDQVTFDVQNAQGDSNTCSTIINSFVSSNTDLILANATPALQAAAAGTNEIPILGTSVTEYGVALDIDNFSGTVGGNISGT
ncbi:MAG: ABC transporter substrate-binding protein, partial [Lachnospiraceae bacterium]|nr:ABC transporter substrate-binding protein [Lachnospiraceae bacterium]